jgi:alpha-galactosidase
VSSPKLTFIGAGSSVFTALLVSDLLATPGLEGGTFGLVDVDASRLKRSAHVVRELVAASGKRWRVEASTDRTDLLPGTGYVVNTIEVAGLACVRPDYEIPLRYGVDQCIGDTIGPGGIFKALRTGPEWLQIVADVERLAPEALVLNYTNPMSILTLAASRAANVRVLGLCHSVQSTSRELARYLDVPSDELEWRCAGINHNAWFTELRRSGEDLYPRLRDRAHEPEVYEQDPVRFEVMLHLGAFVTESSGHFSEYVPYFRKRPDLVTRYTRAGYLGESGFYARNWPTWREAGDERISHLLAQWNEGTPTRSPEYASFIVEALELGGTASIHANLVNVGLIENLPHDGCVEVEVRVGAAGFEPQRFGSLPEQLAALNRAHMCVHELVVQALLERDREKARLALMLDPLSASVCSLEEISAMFDELWAAEQDALKAFSAARSAAETGGWNDSASGS